MSCSLCLPLLLLLILAREALSQAGVDKNDLGDLYKAFVNDLSYFNREYQRLDSDALLGLRVAEGKLKFYFFWPSEVC